MKILLFSPEIAVTVSPGVFSAGVWQLPLRSSVDGVLELRRAPSGLTNALPKATTPSGDTPARCEVAAATGVINVEGAEVGEVGEVKGKAEVVVEFVAEALRTSD